MEWFPFGPPKKQKDKNYKNWLFRRQQSMAAFLRKGNWEILAVQEIRGKGSIKKFIKNFVKRKIQFVAGRSGNLQRLGFFYKEDTFKLLSIKELFSGANHKKPYYHHHSRRPLWARFMHIPSGNTISLINVHLKSNSKEESCRLRNKQAKDLAHWIEKNRQINLHAKSFSLNSKHQALDKDFIILGDFNDTLTKKGICKNFSALKPLKDIRHAMFISTHENIHPTGAATYIKYPYRSVIDHLLVSQSLLKKTLRFHGKSALIIKHGNLLISDHQPIELWLSP